MSVEHSVTVHLKLSDDGYGSESERAAVYTLQDRLRTAIEAASAGEYDGNEFGGGEAVLYAYGPQADGLFKAMESALRESTLRPAFAIVRYGEPDDHECRQEIIHL